MSSSERLCQVVNKKDELIGHKARGDINFQTDIYRIASLWLTNSNNEILIAQRLMTKDKDPGKWGPAVAGTLEQGEDYEGNIYKEAEEEIGLVGISFTKGPKVFLDKPRQAFLQWFVAKCDWPETRFIPQETEVEQVKWVGREWLKDDVHKNPDNYVPAMSSHLETLSSY